MDKNDKKIKEEEDLEEAEETLSDEVQTETSDNEEREALEQRIEEAENKYRRALADYHNLQKRVNEEKQEWVRASNKELLLRLLPVLDTLILANQHIENEGLKVSINQFLDTLKTEGVVKIKTVGEKFDPHLMEAVALEEGEDGMVLEEIRAGYVLYDKLLRPAQVKVGSAKQN
jgi:molecular chaperone GrpE